MLKVISTPTTAVCAPRESLLLSVYSEIHNLHPPDLCYFAEGPWTETLIETLPSTRLLSVNYNVYFLDLVRSLR